MDPLALITPGPTEWLLIYDRGSRRAVWAGKSAAGRRPSASPGPSLEDGVAQSLVEPAKVQPARASGQAELQGGNPFRHRNQKTRLV